MNDNLYIADGFKIPSLNTEIETREVKGRDGFIRGEKKVRGYNFTIPFIYANHSNKDFFDINNELVEFFNREKEVRFRLGGEVWYWNVVFSGTIELTQRTQGFVSFELNCIISDPYKYSNEVYSTVTEEDHMTLLNNGTAHSYPTFKMKALKDSTMLALSKNDEDYFMIGEPEDTFKTPVDASPTVYSTGFSTTVGWSYLADKIPDAYVGGEVGGSIEVDNNSFKIATEPVDKTGWIGAGLKRSLSQTMQDFDITFAARVHEDWRSKKSGKAMTHVLDTSGNLVAALGLLDASGKRNTRLFVAVYDAYGNRKTIVDYSHNMFNSGYTHIRLIRRGQEFIVKAWRMIDWDTYEKNDLYTTRFIDAGELYQAPVVQTSIYLGRHTNSTDKTNPKVFYLRIRKPNGSTEDQIPYVVKAGDEIEIDTHKEIIMINNEPMTELKDFGSSYFSINAGRTEVFIEPQGYFESNAEWRDRFY
jgi:phage-related protein